MYWKIFVIAMLSASIARADLYTDTIGDIDPGITTGGGTLDIVSMEVLNTLSDITFTLTVNGSVTATDWGKFMIGISTLGGTVTSTGNGWSRPINVSTPYGGIDYWIGSWVDGGNGANFFAYNGASWTEVGATYSSNLPGTYSVTPGTSSTLTYVMSLASLGLSVGETIYFDAFSSGGGGGDSAVDALSNPGTSITAWGGPYNSASPNISSYTLVPEPTTIVMFGLGLGAFTRFFRRRKQ